MSFSRLGFLIAIEDRWREKVPLLIGYAFIHEFVVIPASLVALTTLFDTGWGTRHKKNKKEVKTEVHINE